MIFVLKKIFEDKIYKKELASYEIRLLVKLSLKFYTLINIFILCKNLNNRIEIS